MNTPNPLVPQGSLERQSRGKSTVRIAIFTIISIHAVFFAGLLMQGCRRDESKTPLKLSDVNTNQNSLPPLESGYYAGTQDVAVASPPSNAANSNPASSITSLPPVASDSLQTPLIAGQAEPLGEGKPYTIVKGDTLARIAKTHGVTVGAITRANPNLDSRLKPGQKIQIPAPAAAPASTGLGFAEPGKPESPAGAGHLYTVKPGETLTRIAKQHGVTIKAIRTANNLKSDKLVVGQKLKLPASHGLTSASAKNTTVSKLTTTNPAHVTSTSTNAR